MQKVTAIRLNYLSLAFKSNSMAPYLLPVGFTTSRLD
jgi:hypothetical protein